MTVPYFNDSESSYSISQQHYY